MRYEKADTLLQLALDMQASRIGITLEDIQNNYGIGKRTSMRMRDALSRIFPDLEEIVGEDRKKRWRLAKGSVDSLIRFDADELADLDVAIKVMKRENMTEQVRSLEGIAKKLQAVQNNQQALRIDPDLEVLLEAEGLAMRPGPRPRIEVKVVADLRKAIKASAVTVLHYRNRSSGRTKKRIVHPYGFLHGHRNYLIAFHVNPKADRFALFSLPSIEKIEIQSEYFERDESFSLEKYARRSFGVFQEQPFDVKWKFTAEVADIVREFEFHPDQKLDELEDGSLLVSFHAGGELEMAWHLYSWGKNVEVIEPESLKRRVEAGMQSWEATP